MNKVETPNLAYRATGRFEFADHSTIMEGETAFHRIRREGERASTRDYVSSGAAGLAQDDDHLGKPCASPRTDSMREVCEGVGHIISDMTGSAAEAEHVMGNLPFHGNAIMDMKLDLLSGFLFEVGVDYYVAKVSTSKGCPGRDAMSISAVIACEKHGKGDETSCH